MSPGHTHLHTRGLKLAETSRVATGTVRRQADSTISHWVCTAASVFPNGGQPIFAAWKNMAALSVTSQFRAGHRPWRLGVVSPCGLGVLTAW